MSLTGNQRRRLRDALVAAFPTEARLDDLFFSGDFDPPRNRPEITTASGLLDMVREIIVRADGEGWLHQLVTEAGKANNTPELIAFAKETEPVLLAATVNHYRVLLMGERPLIDREPLRDAVQRLAAGQKRILVIDGDPASGKSHTVWFLRYLREQRQGFGLVWIDLRELANFAPQRLVEPVLIARSMAKQMGMADIVHEREEETWAAWTNDFCDTLTGKLAAAAEPWWVVIDSFSAVPLPHDSVGFVKTLCERLAVNIPKLTVILLSYRDSIPDNLEPDVQRETIDAIDEGHIGLFFKELYESLQVQPADLVIAEKTAEVLRAVDPNHPRRLEALGREVIRVAKDIVAKKGQP